MDYTFKDNKIEAPREHYRALFGKLDPAEASARSGVRYDADGRVFRLRYLGREVEISYPGLCARYADSGDSVNPAAEILFARLIIEGRLTGWSGAFLSYAEVPWGVTYLRNFEGRCVKRMAYSFARDLPRFERAAGVLGGHPVRFGDMAADIEFVDSLLMRVILWYPDEEFPPGAQILFSDNFTKAYNAEDLAVVGDLLIDALKEAAE